MVGYCLFVGCCLLFIACWVLLVHELLVWFVVLCLVRVVR